MESDSGIRAGNLVRAPRSIEDRKSRLLEDQRSPPLDRGHRPGSDGLIMRAVIQRVSRAQVEVGNSVVGSIAQGLLVFLGIQEPDTEEDRQWLAHKILQMRIFEDGEGKMNHSVQDVSGGILLISQFTLFGNLKKGTRPSFNRAAPPEKGKAFYKAFLKELSDQSGLRVEGGRFGQHMDIEARQDGPVTLILDTHERKF